MRIPIKLDLRTFASRSECQSFYEGLRDTLPWSDSLRDSDHYDELVDFLSRHHNYREDMDPIDLGLRFNGYNGNEFFVRYRDGNTLPLGITSCLDHITQKDTSRVKMMSWHRKIIEPQIRDYRESCGTGNACGHLDVSSHVDHIYPFYRLVDEFRAQYKGKLPSQYVIDRDGNAIICDKEYYRKWVSYHFDNSVLQMLCQNCNWSKGKK